MILKRENYDRFGEEGINDTNDFSPFDLFKQFSSNSGGFFSNMGDMFGNKKNQRIKPDPIQKVIDVELKDLYNGKKRNIYLSKKD